MLPGHLAPDLGAIRTDAPTTNPTAARRAIVICILRGWHCLLFDVSTAFLTGKKLERKLFARAPGGVPGELRQILRSAYGLAKAPRLWYEEAKRLLEEAGFTEVTFSPASSSARRLACPGDLLSPCRRWPPGGRARDCGPPQKGH